MEIPLQKMGVVLIDAVDYPLVSKYKWYIHRGYARTTIKQNGKTETVLMHRMIMGLQCGDGLHVHHIYHNKLDNRKSQLEVCTPLQNARYHGQYRRSIML